jgi:hypothetical protein
MAQDIDPRNLPEEITATLIPQVHKQFGWASFYESKNGDYIQIGPPVTVTFKLDKRDITSDVIESMRTEIQTIRAESEMKVQQIEERIQSLLALPNGGEQ